MHDLDPIAISKHRFWPSIAAHDLLIQLDRHPLRRKRQFAHQLAQLQFVGNFACFTVDLNLQCLSMKRSRRQDHAAQLGRLSVGLCAE
jgi:hypothetical protein